MKFLLLKSESRLDYSVMLFDVGHGDCLLLLNPSRQGLLVDCGSQIPQLHTDVPRSIDSVLPKNNTCGFIISHYHFDHYSLFHWLRKPELLFHQVYVPYLPFQGPGYQAARAIMDYISAAVLVDYSYYRILPEIFGKTARPIVPCKKGDHIKEASQNLRVLWPDIWNPALGTDRIQRIARHVQQSIEPVLSDLDFQIPVFREADSVLAFFEYLEDLRRQELPEQGKRRVQGILSEIEGAFKDLANSFSIIANSYRKRHSRFLFLGDAEDQILDTIKVPGRSDYICIKAAHHGTNFGKAISGLSTEFLLISRSKKEFPIKDLHDGYLLKLGYRTILSTEFLRHCLVL